MSESILGFADDFRQEIALLASEEGRETSLPEAFTDHLLGILTDAGEIDDAQVAIFEARGMRASGYTLSEDEATLHLFVTDYRSDHGIATLNKAELDTAFRRAAGFTEQAAKGLWRKLEESAAAWDMAHRIYEAWANVAEVRLTMLTNAEVRGSMPEASEIQGRPTSFHVWDLDRLYKLHSSGRTQEPISVNVQELWGEPLACLGPQGEKGAYEAYLLLLPGEFLASVYDLHGPRLLELNVRSFLQSRGKVNRGIQETIRSEPGRFLAYNNGISMTASQVDVAQMSGGGIGLTDIHDLQIVNGGQTTASLHYAKVKNRADLSDVYIQAKLSVVEPEHLEALVPRISEFANSQNKVNMADFSANDPFHVELEKLSRSVWAPAKNGGPQMTRWFYERARGQYADAHARERTPARQRQFKLVHPMNQKFTKTDVAKFENTWDQLPNVVSLGAEKNFREFMLRLKQRGVFTPDVPYFENLVAKAILFRSAEKLIGALNLGGYRAQTVTYTLAKLLNQTGQRINLAFIWQRQALSDPLSEAIQDLGALVHRTLMESAGTRNVSEWAKKPGCWEAVKHVQWQPNEALRAELSGTAGRAKSTGETSVAEILNEDEAAAMTAVMAVSGDQWFELSKWAKETGSLQSWQRSLAFSLGKLAASDRSPSRKQAVQGAKILGEAVRLGFAMVL